METGCAKGLSRCQAFLACCSTATLGLWSVLTDRDLVTQACAVSSFVDGRSFLRIADADPTNDTPRRTALYVERRWEARWDLPPKSSPQYVPPYEGVREQSRIYLRYRDDPWTTKTDPGFKEFYDLGVSPNQLRNLAYYREVSQATLERLQERLVRLRGCRADGCRVAEDG